MVLRAVKYDGKRAILYPNGDVKVGGHINWRGNNPGNIEYNSGYATSQGAIGTSGRFAVFPTMEMGYAAQKKLIGTGPKYKNLSMEDMIHRYNPKGDGNNNPAAYTSYVEAKTGISRNKTMKDMTPEELEHISKTMTVYEGMKAGTLIAGAEVDGNKVTGGTVIDDPSKPNGGLVSYPLCEPTTTPDAGATNKVAQTEGNGAYHETPSNTDNDPIIERSVAQADPNIVKELNGRYKLDQDTAIGLMIELGRVGSIKEAEELWEECSNSLDINCQRLQDDLADRFVSKIKTTDNRYIALYLNWKVGPTTTDEIMQTHNDSGLVTNPTRVKLMDDQEWNKDQPSAGDTNIFFSNLEKYIIERGVDPHSRI